MAIAFVVVWDLLFAGEMSGNQVKSSFSTTFSDRTQPPKQNPTARDALRGENWGSGGLGRLIGYDLVMVCFSAM